MGISRRRAKVAIVGGGCAGMAAAFELSRPQHGFDVSVFQQGWRLGGKGASGRGPSDRIEEHGLHVWMGYYENAFRLMRECYAELGRSPGQPLATWREAFAPASDVSAADPLAGGGWSSWNVRFPEDARTPGDGGAERQGWSVADYLGRAAGLLVRLVSTSFDLPAASSRDADRDRPLAGLGRLVEGGAAMGLAGVLEGLRYVQLTLEQGAQTGTPAALEALLVPALDILGETLLRLINALLGDKPGLARLWGVAEVILATLRGSVRAGLVHDPRGFDAIDDVDTRAWLRQNGASDAALDSSFVRALYDLGFAFEEGHPQRPSIAAGAGLRGSLRAFFGYRGAFFWKMQGGMGDVVFAPLYEVLRRRGVDFRFFHRLSDVHLSKHRQAPPVVEALDFRVQAQPFEGRYEPLIDVNGLPSWPAEPRWSALRDGARDRRRGRDFEAHYDPGPDQPLRLRRGRDFDFVVLATGVSALPFVAPSLVAREERWREMLRHVKTVSTRAFQLWLRPSLAELGWKGPPPSLTAFAQPFDTWADMSHLLPHESWPAGRQPQSVAYFCSALPEQPFADERDARAAGERVKRDAIAFLEREMAHLWPAARTAGGGFRWDWLVDARGREGRRAAPSAAAFDGQFWRANVNPSDRYTLSPPGSLVHRLSPLDVAIDNLTVAGDWTASGLNLGCVEGAVMSGLLASHALCQSPSLSTIVGFDHP